MPQVFRELSVGDGRGCVFGDVKATVERHMTEFVQTLTETWHFEIFSHKPAIPNSVTTSSTCLMLS